MLWKIGVLSHIGKNTLKIKIKYWDILKSAFFIVTIRSNSDCKIKSKKWLEKTKRKYSIVFEAEFWSVQANVIN